MVHRIRCYQLVKLNLRGTAYISDRCILAGISVVPNSWGILIHSSTGWFWINYSVLINSSQRERQWTFSNTMKLSIVRLFKNKSKWYKIKPGLTKWCISPNIYEAKICYFWNISDVGNGELKKKKKN